VIIERLAYASPWRAVAPSAKAIFAGGAMAAAWLAPSPWMAAGLAALVATVTVAGARIPPRDYLRVAMAPMGFLMLSCLTMLVTVNPSPGAPTWRLATEMLPQVLMIATRAMALCAALLWLVLTTPLGDLLALLRRLRCPAVLADLMAVTYRMQSVLGDAWSDGLTAQRARLGHAGRLQSLRSTAQLISQMAVQCWMRASALQAAADARNFDGTLRFLHAAHPNGRREGAVAAAAAIGLILLAAWGRWA
jgi:cobalt/nickel transport system permease protein